MIVEIIGYFTKTDRHTINIDKVESVSIQRSRHGSSENVELVILLTNQTLRIDFISYIDKCESEYKKIVDALRHRVGELKFMNSEG